MREVYFANGGAIDLDVIRVMGVSVKETDSPIGYFGTGLKFAIATLLRHSQEVELVVRGRRFPFTARQKTIRGKPVSLVYMGNEALPFTTDLGKKWKVWQAYRELHSNMLDECGQVSDQPLENDTVIIARGDLIHAEYVNRDQIFIASQPICATKEIEVHPCQGQAVYYRGVRAGYLPEAGAFTYNFLCDMELTEDRNFSSQWDVEWRLATLIPRIDHKGVIAQLLEGTEKWDQGLSFDNCASPSEQFIEVAASRYSDQDAPMAARKVVERDRQARAEFLPAKMNEKEHMMFLNAFPHLQRLGCSLSPEDVEIVESLGPRTMGMHHKGRDQIYLARMTFDAGMETLVATLYEEWLHKAYSYKDLTRPLQTFLFQRLVALSMGQDGPEPKDQKPGAPF